VSDGYENPFAFTGKIAKVTIDLIDLIDDNEQKNANEAIVKKEADGVLKRKISD
jgi:hypothetical protein